jgi:penicillin-binding protein 1C
MLIILYFPAVMNKEKFTLYVATFLVFLILMVFLSVPVVRFDKGFSTVILAEDGSLLGARIAPDEQWRFPGPDTLSDRFYRALLTFEDKRFEIHRGIDPIALIRALTGNLRRGNVISGGSTLTMQLARIHRGNPARTVWNKMIEMVIAWKSELVLGKRTILHLYLENAPFGGNIVGLETASWRYYNKQSADLSWAEASTLAVLPNSPGLIHPGRNREQLRAKRDRLLFRLLTAGIIDRQSYSLALLEELPEVPYPFPQNSLHLVQHLTEIGANGRIWRSSVDHYIQNRCAEIVDGFAERYSQNGIHNLAVLIVENRTGKVVSYIGNTRVAQQPDREFYVDMIRASRSSGSILKPLLFAAALDRGLITPEQLLPDIPGNISGYRPRNFNREFEGAVQADRALIRSLNVPMVYLLQDYTIDRFLYDLKGLGFRTIDGTAEHYGLPLILGGADVSLWDLVKVYSGMARVLENYVESEGHYFPGPEEEPVFDPAGIDTTGRNAIRIDRQGLFSAGAIWQTFGTMTQLERPDRSGHWRSYVNSRKIAWKTGTSFGLKDAWSVGVSREYTVGVWVGNATGEGRAGLTGIEVAAPVLFALFDLLPVSNWFREPTDDLKTLETCRDSGFPAGPHCAVRQNAMVPFYSDYKSLCPYHVPVQLDGSGTWRLEGECPEGIPTITRQWFVLPPLMEYFYAGRNPGYLYLPPVHPDCLVRQEQEPGMALIYPSNPTRIRIPIEFSGEEGRVVFRLAHRDRSARVFWYIDDELVSTTQDFHEIALFRPAGEYQLLVLDESGNRLHQRFKVLR